MELKNPPLRELFDDFPIAATEAIESLDPGQMVEGWWVPQRFIRSTHDPVSFFTVIVRAGRLRVHHPDDRKVNGMPLAVLEEGQIWIGSEEQRGEYVFAAAPRAMISVIPRERLNALCRNHEAIRDEVARQLAANLSDAHDRFHESRLPLEERLLRELARWGRRHADGTIKTDTRLTQDQLAALVGACRETVNRAARALINAGRLRRFGQCLYAIPAPPSASVTA